MTRALLLVAGWIGRAMAMALASSRRPAVAEIAALRERLARQQEVNDLLRSRLEGIDPHRRPH